MTAPHFIDPAGPLGEALTGTIHNMSFETMPQLDWAPGGPMEPSITVSLGIVLCAAFHAKK